MRIVVIGDDGTEVVGAEVNQKAVSEYLQIVENLKTKTKAGKITLSQAFEDLLDNYDEEKVFDFLAEEYELFEKSYWADYVDEADIEEYAMENLNMINACDWDDHVENHEIRTYAEENLDMVHVDDIGKLIDDDPMAYIDEDFIEDYARENLDMMTWEDAKGQLKDLVDDS